VPYPRSEDPAISQAGDYSGLPGVHVTIDQIVAINIRYWRRKAGLTQAELGERIGWTAANVSNAELSARDDKDKRRFDAHTLITLARALEISVPALLMPPEDDGIARRYQFHAGGREYASDCLQMFHLMNLILSDPWAGDSPQDAAYRSRYATAVSTYLEAGRGEMLAAYAGDLTTREQQDRMLERLAWQREALAALVADIDQTVDAIVDSRSTK
jgi:transcriptional regulator with XRE-family HTH domain